MRYLAGRDIKAALHSWTFSFNIDTKPSHRQNFLTPMKYFHDFYCVVDPVDWHTAGKHGSNSSWTFIYLNSQQGPLEMNETVSDCVGVLISYRGLELLILIIIKRAVIR